MDKTALRNSIRARKRAMTEEEIVSRSEESILREAKRMAKMPDDAVALLAQHLARLRA